MLSLNLCEPGNFYESYSSGVLPDKFPTVQLYQKREVYEMLCIEEVGVDLELVFMPMETM